MSKQIIKMQNKIKKGGNVPNLRFPGFVGEWEMKKLGDVTEKIGDGLHGTPIYIKESDYSFINGNNLENGKIELRENTKKVDLETFLKNDKGLSENSLLISLNGTIGNIARYNNEKVMLGKSVGYFNFRHSSNFLYFTLQTKSIQDFFKSELTGSTIKNLSLKTLRETEISFPFQNEQHKITCFLSLIDERIQTQNKIIKELKFQKTSVVKMFFGNNLKFKNSDIDFSNWERKTLGEVSNEHLNKNPKNLYSEVFSVSKHQGVINQIEHLGRSFSAKEILHYKLVYPGDLVYTKSPTSEFPFGIIKQNRTGRIGVVSPLYCVFTPKTYSLGYLIHEYFNSPVNTFNYLNPLVQKGAKNTMNINNNTFLNGEKLLLPVSEKEQNKIYTILSQIEEKLNLEKKLLVQYEKQKKYLLLNMLI